MRDNFQEISYCYFQPTFIQPYFDNFIQELSKNGYSQLTIKGYHCSISHFAIWIKNKKILFKNISDKDVNSFSRHRCRCRINGRKCKISKQYLRRIKRFISYLIKRNVIVPRKFIKKTVLPPHFLEFKESLESRGLSSKTISSYERAIYPILSELHEDTKKYNAPFIRRLIINAAKKYSRGTVKKLTTALRVYLRFLSTKDMCTPNLDSAVPAVAEWRLSSLPKYITPHELEKVIASCDIHTKQGLRDRAIILLLSRLGLRAGDVSEMHINDINWLQGTLKVFGKSRREVLLPLPQEVGDALLSYIKKARPLVFIDKLFLCLNAPYRPFPTSSGISSVVCSALLRANIENPPSCGAHLLRHTAATNMLRQGASLETVSTVLRHRSLDMTAYYAKVDIPRLRRIAQPWPEVRHAK
jgi:site-specific recombinase XerD